MKHKPTGQDDGLTLARPAPADPDADLTAPLPTMDEIEADENLHTLFVAYAEWCRSRRFFAPPPINGSLLGKLSSKTARPSNGGADADCSAEMSAIHLAVIAQPVDALDRKVFELHYLWNVKSIKAAAAALDVSRPHWYRLLNSFRNRVMIAARSIMDDNAKQRAAMEKRRADLHDAGQ